MGKDYSNKKYASLNEMRIATESPAQTANSEYVTRKAKVGANLAFTSFFLKRNIRLLTQRELIIYTMT